MKQVRIYFDRTGVRSQELSVKLHGFLMSLLPTAYVDVLHQQETNPYSTRIYDQGEEQVWEICLLTPEAQKKILPALQGLEVIALDYRQLTLAVKRLEETELLMADLVADFYQDIASDDVTLTFVSSTAFKSQGDYVIFPDLGLMFQSLMLKYARLVEGTDDIDRDLLASILDAVKISHYDLRTRYFPVHRTWIPGFCGRIRLRLRGASSLKAYIYLLLRFGEMSGIGIKTSLGMGGLHIESNGT